MMNKIISIVTLLFLISLITSCEDANQTPYNSNKILGIYLTDCPFEADEVNVEILNVIVEDKDGFKIELNTAIGVYNLLDFTNGVDTLLAEGNVELEDIESIYLELGDDNTIVVDSVLYPLQLQSDKLVKININLDKFDESTDFIVDFFACTSIIEKNGEYFLKPVIKFKGQKNNQGGIPDFVEDFIEDITGCYTLVYPYSLVTKTNDEITVNNDEELTDALINNEIKNLVYPVSLQDIDGENTTVENKGDLKQLIKDCLDSDDDDDDDDNLEYLEELLSCYSVLFPIEVYNESDTIQIADSLTLISAIEGEEYEAVILPFDLVDIDGDIINVADNDTLKALSEDCEDDDENDFAEFVESIKECFTLVFPLDLKVKPNNTITANDQDEFDLFIDTEDIKSFVYPIQLIDENDDTINVTSNGQLKQLISDCE